MEFPVYNSKALSDGKTYDLSNTADRWKYFHAKLGSKIDDIKAYLDKGTFVGYMLAKKQAGKGTYAKMLQEVLGEDHFGHISVGDIVRKYHKSLAENLDYKASELYAKLNKKYRGSISLDSAIADLMNRRQDKVSVQDELILAMLQVEIDTLPRKALFIDGLPRTKDQISYSLLFRNLINYRDDPDFFVLISVEESMIDARMKTRVVCPICHTSKSLMFNPTKYVKWDEAFSQPYYLCDNELCSGCGHERLLSKEGDSAGKASIANRIADDHELMKHAFALHGIPKMLIRSAVPVDIAHDYLEDYEIQPNIVYTYQNGAIERKNVPWKFKDDNGVECFTMYAATYVLNIIDQLHSILML